MCRNIPTFLGGCAGGKCFPVGGIGWKCFPVEPMDATGKHSDPLCFPVGLSKNVSPSVNVSPSGLWPRRGNIIALCRRHDGETFLSRHGHGCDGETFLYINHKGKHAPPPPLIFHTRG